MRTIVAVLLTFAIALPAAAVIPLSTQTYRNSSGGISIASSPQRSATGYSPHNGSRTANGYTVFDNRGGAGSAMDSRGNIHAGRFDVQASTGRTVFMRDR
jgi:hypothetical protein